MLRIGTTKLFDIKQRGDIDTYSASSRVFTRAPQIPPRQKSSPLYMDEEEMHLATLPESLQAPLQPPRGIEPRPQAPALPATGPAIWGTVQNVYPTTSPPEVIIETDGETCFPVLTVFRLKNSEVKMRPGRTFERGTGYSRSYDTGVNLLQNPSVSSQSLQNGSALIKDGGLVNSTVASLFPSKSGIYSYQDKGYTVSRQADASAGSIIGQLSCGTPIPIRNRIERGGIFNYRTLFRG